ncbi:MAG: ribose 1,5-bisphosphate isomerase, partial [Archaeoglobi archaeon]|nr:ribose 1,5-bisphosphate isomerase [Archaeoglobi archaeon]
MNMVEEAAKKIESMEVRGAAKIAKFAAETLKEYAKSVKTNFDEEMRRASQRLMNTRPTAVSLFNAINYVMSYSGESDEEKRESLIKRAEEFVEWVDTAREKIGRIGAKRIMGGSTVMTHCNSSAALSVIKHAFDEGKDIRVIATESRPRHQGYLTTKELADYGI